MIKHLVMLALVAGACDSANTCEDALSNVLGYSVGLNALGIDTAHVADVHKLGALDCEHHPWSEMTRTCLARASEEPMMRACLASPELEVFRVAAAGVADPYGV